MNMSFKLSKTIKVGHRIKTTFGWRIVKEVTLDGVLVKEGLIRFGDVIYGWKG